MPRKPKMQTSNDLIRENCEWPMTAGQVAKLTGVTTRALQHYDEKGLLCPERSGEGVANNRKLYSPEDIDRLKQIVVLGSYGFELKDMPPILDGERSLTDALADRIEELRAQERYGNTFMSPPEWGNRMCSYTRDDIRDDRLEQVV